MTAKLCPPCAADYLRYLDYNTWPTLHTQIHTIGRDDRKFRRSLGAQRLDQVRSQLDLIRRICARDHQPQLGIGYRTSDDALFEVAA